MIYRDMLIDALIKEFDDEIWSRVVDLKGRTAIDIIKGFREKTLLEKRTIKGAVEEIKALDPGTAITEHALRKAVLAGKIPCTYVGSRALVNLSDVLSMEWLDKGV